jgi:glycosyltransferase involved in cell wall biosynthesis
MRVLYPKYIDRWRSPIATLLREIAARTPHLQFYSFSSPETEEDRLLGKRFWALPHVHRERLPSIVLREYDVVHHASATRANLLAARAAKLRSFRRAVHVFTANIQPSVEDPHLREYQRSIELADVVVAVSAAVASDVAALYGRRVDAIIPNGVDFTFFSRTSAEPVDLEALGVRRPYVLFCATITRRKRPDVFIDIARHLPSVDFVMVGGSHHEAELRAYLEMARGVPNVKHLGRRSRTLVRDLMAEAEALVFPSEREGLSLAVLEALAMGLPVLAQPRSSLPEVVRPGETGWLLETDDLRAWARVLEEVLSWDTDTRTRFAERARAFIACGFSFEHVAHEYAKLYGTACH